MKKSALTIIFIIVITFTISSPVQAQSSWPMPGANPQRTNWVSENGPSGKLQFLWITPLEPQIPYTSTPIAAEGKVFVPTSRGIYAFDANTGTQIWVFATEMPIPYAPTYDNGSLYFGGLDRKVYKITAANGNLQWSFTGDAGFSTNPVVTNNSVYIGSRGGIFYGINATTGTKVWEKVIGGSIYQSAAYSATTNQLFFGAMDGNTYALDAANGDIKWQKKLPGMGWGQYWPVVYKDQVIFTPTEFARNGSEDFSKEVAPEYIAPDGKSITSLIKAQQFYLFPTYPPSIVQEVAGSVGTVPGSWPAGNLTVDLTQNPLKPGFSVTNFLEDNFAARNMVFLRQDTGTEVTFDLDNDGKVDPAPFLRTIEDNKTVFPPVIRTCPGCEDIIYSRNPILQDGSLSGSLPIGWKYGDKYASLAVSCIFGGLSPCWEEDESFGTAGAGNFLYWNKNLSRNVGGVNITIANTSNTYPVDNVSTRQWRYVNPEFPTAALTQMEKYKWQPPAQAELELFYNHTTTSPIAYQGKIFVLARNTITAFASVGSTNPVKPTAPNPPSVGQTATTLPATELQTRLADQITKLTTKVNGNFVHYKPGYAHTGRFDQYGAATDSPIGDSLLDYWSNPAETITILISALPHLNSTLQTALKDYIKFEYTNYSPATTAHIGWKDGAFRESFIWPVGMNSKIQNLGKQSISKFTYWSFPPQNIYAVWKYVQSGLCTSPCTASSEFNLIKGKLPANFPYNSQTSFLNTSYPHVLNAYIAGYEGYVELAKLANESQLVWGAYQTTLDALKASRKNQFTTILVSDTGPNGLSSTAESNRYFHLLHQAYNFMYLTPELGTYLNTTALSTMHGAIDMYTNKATSLPGGNYNGSRAAYWMQAHNDLAQGEDGIVPYQQTYALFQAKAKVLKESQSELSKYIDTSQYPVGDLYYIDNLVAALNAGTNPPPPTLTITPVPSSTLSPTPPSLPGDINGDTIVNIQDYIILSNSFGLEDTAADVNQDGIVNIQDYIILSNNFGKTN